MATDFAKLRNIFGGKYDGSDPDWGGGSGPGSDPYFNLPYREFLENFIRMNHIGDIVDIGCGDWQFSRYLDLRGVNYLGLDLVPSLMERNQGQFGSDTTRFAVMPDRLEDVTGGQLLIMKDVLQHLEAEDIARFHDIVFPKFAFCLITNSYRKVAHDGALMGVNTPIAAGDFRCIDLRSEPFNIKGLYVLRFYTGAAEELRTLLIQN